MRLWLTFLICLWSVPVQALEITLREMLSLNRPASIAFDPLTCTLWVANDSAFVTQLAPNGEEVSQFTSSFGAVRAIGVDREGLLLVTTFGRFQRTDRMGNAMETVMPDPVPYDVEGLELMMDGSYWIVSDDPSYVTRYDPSGKQALQLNGMTMSPILSEPQGIAIDSLSGHLLITDDNEGFNALFELDAAGNFLGMTSLDPYGRDPEGIAVHAQTRTIWIAFDSGQRLGIFDYVPSQSETELDPGPDCALS